MDLAINNNIDIEGTSFCIVVLITATRIPETVATAVGFALIYVVYVLLLVILASENAGTFTSPSCSLSSSRCMWRCLRVFDLPCRRTPGILQETQAC